MADGADQPAPSCPVPHSDGERVQLAHGGGGRAMARLIETMFLEAFDNPLLRQRHDGAAFALDGHIALTTDSYVVRPLAFPGGDIGTLAINGTVNDLAMCGARPLYLTLGLILEEGLPLAELERVVRSVAAAARAAGVSVVAGDTKVVERGKADGLYINTTGIGRIEAPRPIGPTRIEPGNVLLVSGDIGRHGIAVMAARDALGFQGTPQSDCAPVHEPVLALIADGIDIRCLRDLTRGGLASALVEIAETAGLTLGTDEDAIPVDAPVRAACELLGLDPIHVANEGRFVAFVPDDQAERALSVLRRHPVSRGAVIAGRVVERSAGQVLMTTPIGGTRVVDMLSGEQLPRIC